MFADFVDWFTERRPSHGVASLSACLSGRAVGRRAPPRDLFRDRSWRSYAYEESFNGKFRDRCLNEEFPS